MAGKTALWRVGAGVAAGAVLLTACTGSDDGAETTGADPAAAAENVQPRDDKLDLGFIYDETGPLSFLTPPQPAAIQLAVEDINAAGGVNGQDVTLEMGDEAGEPSVVRETAAKFVNEDKDAVIGAAASGMSQEIIQLLHDHRIVQCSSSNTSPTFSTQANNTYYFRTVPPDEAVAPLIAEWIVERDNHTDVAVVARDDDYGRALGDLIVAGVTARDATATRIDYDPNAESFGSVVDEIVAADPEAVALIAFGEAIPILVGSFAAGLEPAQFYGSDGLYGTYISAAVLDATGETEEGANPVSGVTVFGAGGSAEFNDRLRPYLPEGLRTDTAYGGQTYDCAIIVALAAIAADSVDPWVFYEHIADVTKEGTKCTSFAECSELLANGEDIDYDGASGALEITHPDPAVGGYQIATFQDDGTLRQVGDQDVDLTDLGG